MSGLGRGLAQQGLTAAPMTPQLKLRGCQSPRISPQVMEPSLLARPRPRARPALPASPRTGTLTLLSSCRLNDMWTIGLQDRELTCWEEVRGWGPGLRLWGDREVRCVGGSRVRRGREVSTGDRGLEREVRREVRGSRTGGPGWVGVEAAIFPSAKAWPCPPSPFLLTCLPSQRIPVAVTW